MKHFLPFHEAEPDCIVRRAQYRLEHFALAWAAYERGEMILAGSEQA